MSWPTFLKRMEDARRRGRYEPVRADRRSPLQWFVGESKPRAVLITTKRYLVDAWLPGGALDDSMAIAVRYGLPTQVAIDAVRKLAKGWRSPLFFIGDLDPLDLSAFKAYRRGNANFRGGDARRSSMSYIGIDDEWMDLCERSLKPGLTFDALLIHMATAEQEHFRVIEPLFPDMEEVIGSRAVSLLRSGRKLEIEGASNPGLYRRGFATQLRNHVLKRITRR